MSSFDTNVSNYSIPELFTIISLEEEDATIEEVIDITQKYIEKYKNKPQVSVFFQQIQLKIIEYLKNKEEPPTDTQTDYWYQNQYLNQTNNTVQTDKITDRKQKVEFYNNDHLQMKQQQIGVTNNYNVPVSQDALNPNLENITTRVLNLDSQFRQATSVTENSSTDYTLDLSDPLTNVLSMRLFSYQIPYTWYTIDTTYSNNCFWFIFYDNSGTFLSYASVTVEPGNYSPSDFVNHLNDYFNTPQNGFNFTSSTPVTYNQNNGKIKLDFFNGTYSNLSQIYTINTNTEIVFFDPTAQLLCSTKCVNQTYVDQTLGWIMGFRLPNIKVKETGNISPAILNLSGPKYLILVIDDYNQNHINNGLVSIAELSKKLKLPNYYSPDLPYICQTSLTNSNLTQLTEGQENNPDIGLIIADKLDMNYKDTPTILPTAPRVLTQSQIYTINEIMKNNENNTNYRSKAPTSNDVFAVLPIKSSGENIGTVLVEFSGSLQEHKRTYFGPVNIDRMRIKLLDDKGNVLNMNGADWCVTIICECLYQY